MNHVSDSTAPGVRSYPAIRPGVEYRVSQRMEVRVRAFLVPAILVSLVTVTRAADVPGAGGSFYLVRDGRPAASIVTSASPSPNAKAAAAELRKYLEKMTGASLSLATDDAPPPGPLVLVGPSKLTAALPGLDRKSVV